ncbi:unnamed protein product [Parascedosporium putredinis]|uniref:Uncharacterized protein n=1 Tax=Parascedosporium putredinis TaxID=1442378 RepID=A0A9P1H2H7_9PEZI|nr:unnamed protein product [Parascedosporium putredinis]CAI7993604.1 unnamed protein product [Parascedosporium putredinis]
MAYYRADENLPEVVPDASPEAIPKHAAAQYPNHLHDHNAKYPVILDDSPKFVGAPNPSPPPFSAVSPYTETLVPGSPFGGPPPAESQAPAKTICGLRKKNFWILFVLVLVVLAAALGGGIGGGLAANKGSKAAASAGSDGADQGEETASESPTETGQDAEATHTAASTQTKSSTSSAPDPSETIRFLNETIPTDTFAFQAWSKKNFQGEVSPIYRTEGLFKFGFEAVSYIWLPNSTACCVTFATTLACGAKNFTATSRADRFLASSSTATGRKRRILAQSDFEIRFEKKPT